MQYIPSQKIPSTKNRVLRFKKVVTGQQDQIKNATPKNALVKKDYRLISNLIAEREPQTKSTEKNLTFTAYEFKARESLNRVKSRLSHIRTDASFSGTHQDTSKESEFKFAEVSNKSNESFNIKFHPFGLQKNNYTPGTSQSPFEMEVANMTPTAQKNFLVQKEINKRSPTPDLNVTNSSMGKVTSPTATANEGRHLKDGYNIPVRRSTFDKTQNKYMLNLSNEDNLANPFIIKSITKKDNEHIYVGSEDLEDDEPTESSYQRVNNNLSRKIMNILTGKRRSQDVTLTSPSFDMTNQQNVQQPQQAQKKRPKLKLVPIFDCKLTTLYPKGYMTSMNMGVTKMNFNLNTNKKEVFSPVNEMDVVQKPHTLPLTQSRSNSVDNIRFQKLKI